MKQNLLMFRFAGIKSRTNYLDSGWTRLWQRHSMRTNRCQIQFQSFQYWRFIARWSGRRHWQGQRIVGNYETWRFGAKRWSAVTIGTSHERCHWHIEWFPHRRVSVIPNGHLLEIFSSENVILRYPREKNQGIAFESAIAPVDLIIALECSPETMVERILKRAAASVEKRADDNEETIKNRIATFIRNTDEILNQYSNQTKRVIYRIAIHTIVNQFNWF